MKYNIYFDCASTVKPYPEAIKVFSDISMNDFANASSNHALGFQCSSILLRARTQIAKYLHVTADEIIFTSGASEGNNLAIKGISYHNKGWAKESSQQKRNIHPCSTSSKNWKKKDSMSSISIMMKKENLT